MKKFLLLGLVMVISCKMYGQQEESLTFEKAVEIGLENNFDVKIASNQVLLAENEKKQAGIAL